MYPLRGIHSEVAGARAARSLAIQRGQHARHAINGERGDVTRRCADRHARTR